MEPIYNINENAVYETEIKALQDTDSSSATQTFNPLFEKMLNNTHTVKKDVEEVSNKVKWTEYTALEDLGLTDADIVASGTLATICEAMPAYSTISLYSDSNLPWRALLPSASGVLTIKKDARNLRIFLYFELSDNTGKWDKWTALYREDGIGHVFEDKVSSWRKIITDNIVKWTQYTSLSDLGLTDTDIVTSATLVTLINKMINFSELNLYCHYTLDWFNLLPGTQPGVLNIKRHGDNYRVFLTFSPVSVNTTNMCPWYATYRIDNGMSKWVQFAKQEYNSLSDLGLTDADITASGTLATICAAMPNWSTAILPIDDSFPLVTELFPYSWGTLTIKRYANANRTHLLYETAGASNGWDRRYTALYRGDIANGTGGFTNHISEWLLTPMRSEFEELKRLVVDGKIMVANALAAKGIDTKSEDSFATIAEKIAKIKME